MIWIYDVNVLRTRPSVIPALCKSRPPVHKGQERRVTEAHGYTTEDATYRATGRDVATSSRTISKPLVHVESKSRMNATKIRSHIFSATGRRSQGVQWVRLRPPRAEKKFRRKLQ